MSNLRGVLIPALPALLALSLLVGCDEDDIERSLGKQTSAAVEKEFGLNNDPVLGAWVNTLGHSLVGQSKRQGIPYHFRVVNTDMVNAFAAPWGYIYVTQGMLRFAQSEDELAFVVGHEVGHVANRDSIKSFKNSILFNIGVALLGTQSETLANIGGIGAGLLMLSYSRDDENDADLSGSAFAYASGYDPAGSTAFFQRLMTEIEKDRPSSFEHIFMTHPPTDKRLAAEKKRPEMNLADPAVVEESIQITRHALEEYRRLRASGAVDDMANHPEVVLRTAELLEEARTVIRAIEQCVPSSCSAEGLYRILAGGFLPVPYLWECRDEFRSAVRWHTRLVRGSVKVVDEKGNPIPAATRMETVVGMLSRESQKD